jgi:hypothetical protein
VLLGVAAVMLVGASPAHAAPAKTEHTQHARRGALRAAYSYQSLRATPYLALNGHIRIWNGTRLVVNRGIGPGWGPGGTVHHGKVAPARVISILQLDGTGPREVVLNLWAGGAHCCARTYVFTGSHRTVHDWGDFPPARKDVDGDGKPEFHAVDARFAYAFSSFAESLFPVSVWNYADGAFHDVTRSYPAEMQADFARQYAEYTTARDAGSPAGVRSALAAYAADGYLLGQGDAAMAVVQAAVDARQTGTAKTDTDPFWEPGYLGTLRAMLIRFGYAPPAA